MIARGGPAAAATLRTVSGVNRYAHSVGLVTLAPGMVIGMAGCAAGSESPTPTETVTVTTTPSPSSAPPSPAPSGSGAAGRSIPDCETLVPLDVVQAQPGWERYEFVGQYLDAQGVAVRVGHHCAQPLHRRYGVTASTRASAYLYTTDEECERFLAALAEVRGFFGAGS